MLENFKAEFTKGLNQQKEKEKKLAANPNSIKTKNYNRTMGLVSLAIGVLGIITVIISYFITGNILKISLAVAIAFPIIGIWMIITGKKINK